ncbi:MAG: hypothetical protein FWG82_00895 [Oscillospiraceae bacterium]|nr:hypothetical protein [Oscillospiraceae bacterium]
MRRKIGRNFNITPYVLETLHGVRANRRLLLLWVLFAVGMAAGARFCAVGNGFLGEQIDVIFSSWYARSTGDAFWVVLRSSLLTNTIFAAAAILMGLSATGFVLIGCLPLLRGMGLGILSGQLYSEYALQGLWNNLLLLVPGAFFSVFGLLLLCKENMESSQAFGIAAKRGAFPEEWQSTQQHLKRCGVLIAFAILGALLDAGIAAMH